MANKAARGTKRTCQNDECGSHFYDLNRDPIICPICETEYVIASAPLPVETPEPEKEDKEKAKTKEGADGDDALDNAEGIEDIEDSDDISDDDEDDTFLATDDDQDDSVPDIIVGGKKGSDNEDS